MSTLPLPQVAPWGSPPLRHARIAATTRRPVLLAHPVAVGNLLAGAVDSRPRPTAAGPQDPTTQPTNGATRKTTVEEPDDRQTSHAHTGPGPPGQESATRAHHRGIRVQAD